MDGNFIAKVTHRDNIPAVVIVHNTDMQTFYLAHKSIGEAQITHQQLHEKQKRWALSQG